jgi:hypothetical protein
MPPDSETAARVRSAVAGGQYHLLYTMVPAMDGGQTYEMKCKICGEFGNILAGGFDHARDCPVPAEEERFRKLPRWRRRLAQWFVLTFRKNDLREGG